MGGAAERPQGRGIGGPRCEHAGGLDGIARRHELAGRAGHHEIGDAADARRQYGKTGGHRLENRVRQALPIGDQDERVAVGELLRDVAAMAEQHHAIAEAERIAMPLDLLAVGAVAEHAQLPGLAARLGERVQQRDQILGRRESRSAAEHEAAAGGRCGGSAAGASTPLWMTCRLPRGAMPRSRASCRSWLETHTIASVRGATACSLAV